MAEEQTQAPEQKKGGGAKKLLGMLMGLVFIVVGIALVVVWVADLLVVIRGCLGLFLALAGAITIAISKE